MHPSGNGLSPLVGIYPSTEGGSGLCGTPYREGGEKKKGKWKGEEDLDLET